MKKTRPKRIKPNFPLYFYEGNRDLLEQIAVNRRRNLGDTLNHLVEEEAARLKLIEPGTVREGG